MPDPSIPLSERADFEEEMKAARAHWRLIVHGGAVHCFTDPDADSQDCRYNETADRVFGGPW